MDSCEAKQLFSEDASGPTPEGRVTLRTIIALVHPLCRGGGKSMALDIAEDIMVAAERFASDERLELERLCAVFSIALEHIGNAILSALATYLATLESVHTLKGFLESIEQLTDALADAYDTSIIEAFRLQLLNGLSDDPF